jgi:DNA-binding MarR family transcriptional regulator
MAGETNRLEDATDKLIVFFPLFYKKAMKVWQQAQGNKLPNQYYTTLGMLIKHGPMPMSDVGNLLCISKPNTTFVVNKLITEGKIERLNDKKDRRIINISITDKGREYFNEHKKNIKKNLKETLSNLSEEELNTLNNSIDRLNSLFSKID